MATVHPRRCKHYKLNRIYGIQLSVLGIFLYTEYRRQKLAIGSVMAVGSRSFRAGIPGGLQCNMAEIKLKHVALISLHG